MKGMTKNIIVGTFLISGLFLVGCQKDTPKCSDSDSKELVLNIVVPKIKNQLVGRYMMDTAFRFKPTYNYLLKQINSKDFSSKEDQKQLLYIKRKVDEVTNNISITSIRTESSDEKNRKTQCSADLNLNGRILPIKYELQYTDDDKLYATVYR